jgi:hypothetical protein
MFLQVSFEPRLTADVLLFLPLFLPYPSCRSKLTLPSSDMNQPPLVHGCVGPLGGATTNWNAIAGWVKYHHERWGMTHADIFVLDHDTSLAKELFNAVGLELTDVALNFTHQPAINGDEAWLAKECRTNAIVGQRDFLIEFELGQFLVSDSFGSLQDIFDYTNEPDAVVFPSFTNNYGICNSNAMTFASATFVDHLFPDFARTPSLCPRTKRCNMSDGVTRHFMIGNDIQYHPANSTDNNKSAHLIRFTNTDGANRVGLHEDMSTNPCATVKDCKNILEDTRECTDVDEIAGFQQQVTSINSILTDLDLTSGLKDLKQNALCYARRYPDLFKGYCQGDTTKCHHAGLHDHYVMHGSKSNLIWQCDRAVSPAKPVTHRILGG